ncbi:MAG TPA: HAMP domain-containing protein [bacterium]|nr:HAMP domain-containing protein [bacterium]
MKSSILGKLTALILILTLAPLAALGFMALNDIKGMGDEAVDSVDSIGETAVADSTKSLNDLGKTVIMQKAIDVAKQIEIYVKNNPTKTIADMQADEYFNAIAVQPVGLTGYTALTDVDTLYCRWHANPKVANTDLHGLAEKLPGFWGVMEKSQGGVVSEGYYDWLEADGSTKQKYMYIAIVDAKTADGVQLSVAATTYIEEFSAPVADLQTKIDAGVTDITKDIDAGTQAVQQRTLILIVVTIAIAALIGILFARSLTTPIKQLTKAGNEIAAGNLDTKLPVIKSKDEIKALGDTVSALVDALKFLKESKK